MIPWILEISTRATLAENHCWRNHPPLIAMNNLGNHVAAIAGEVMAFPIHDPRKKRSTVDRTKIRTAPGVASSGFIGSAMHTSASSVLPSTSDAARNSFSCAMSS